jgi:hypothetical protein
MLLRYHYPDGRLQAALPMHLVVKRSDVIVGWLPAGSEISYWANPDGTDPRTVAVENRFRQHLGTARRRWAGGGILRVIPLEENWQVLHFWDPATGEFLGWYVNLESPKRFSDMAVDAIDWYLDLVISPTPVVSWKDEEEAAAAAETSYLRREDLAAAQAAGEVIAADPEAFVTSIGDWRHFVPPNIWGPLNLPERWDQPTR